MTTTRRSRWVWELARFLVLSLGLTALTIALAIWAECTISG